jgi:methyl-accepting chemotaxis protein
MGTFFGLYALSGTATMWLGPMLVAWGTVATQSQQGGFATVLILPGLGFVLLLGVKVPGNAGPSLACRGVQPAYGSVHEISRLQRAPTAAAYKLQKATHKQEQPFMTALLERLSIRTKVLGLLALVSVIAAIVAMQGIRGVTAAESSYSPIVLSENPATVNLVRANRQVVEMVYAGYRALAYDGASKAARDAAAAAEASHAAAMQNLQKAKELDPSTAEKVAVLEQRVKDIYALVTPAVEAGLRNDSATATSYLTRTDRLLADLSKEMGAYNNARVDRGAERAAEAGESVSSTITVLIAVSVIGIVGGLFAGFIVAQVGITGPLNGLKDTMRRLSGGETDVDVPGVHRADELGEMAKTVLVFKENAVAKAAAEAERARVEAAQQHLFGLLTERLSSLADGKLNCRIEESVAPSYEEVKGNFNGAIDALAGLVGSVIEGAANIQTGTEEISRASEDLARRTESNAASLEQTSAAVAEMEGRLKATADAARESVKGSEAAMIAVSTGRTRTVAAVQAMEKVSDSAKGIDNVIEGLDKIAFQTRVLAMNAAVEAGRAGDAGRGFAVVADLVSALAMRAEEEAKLARDQLTITQTEIASAVGAVELVNNALAEIASTGEQAKVLSTQIASDNVAQSSAISEIASVLSTMDTATQQNAAMVEETSAAARTLKTEVGSLVDQANSFDLGTTARAPRPAAAPVRTAAIGAQIRKRPDRSAAAAPKPQLTPVPAAPSRNEGEWRDF